MLSTGVATGVNGTIEYHASRFQVENIIFPALPSSPKPQLLSQPSNKIRSALKH